VEILTDIPFELDLKAFSERLHVEPGSADAAELADLLDNARAVGSPKAVYKESYVEARGDGTVTLDGVTFTSRALRANLDGVERVFPYLATCGNELDRIPLPPGDMFKAFWLDEIKATLLGFSADHLRACLDRRFALGKTSTMSPGEGEVSVWPIEQQAELFSLFGDTEGLIGVELTDSFLMVPNKTMSGIRFPSEIDYRSCQLCRREDCPGRAAPFDRALWESVQRGTERNA